MKVSIEEVEKVALLSMVELTELQKERMQQDLGDILEHCQKLNELPTEGVEPTTYILKQQNVFRADVPAVPSKREEMLQNAPEQQDGGFIVPKVVE
ncbi:MAG: Asp-tRNA(Asn)/Glu-tRNA(Gln) amidotransferase subunit GatC [Christensenellaceae bacterium]|jgi:aspartyl-tRNA(Asn)/glutamyl-tRNA(Gln) amidotransferase subunit C